MVHNHHPRWIAWLMFPGNKRSLAQHDAIMGRREEQVWRHGESLHLRGKNTKKSYRDRTLLFLMKINLQLQALSIQLFYLLKVPVVSMNFLNHFFQWREFKEDSKTRRCNLFSFVRAFFFFTLVLLVPFLLQPGQRCYCLNINLFVMEMGLIYKSPDSKGRHDFDLRKSYQEFEAPGCHECSHLICNHLLLGSNVS